MDPSLRRTWALTMWQPQGFLALLCLLALATSASAECAWVLWVAEYGPGFHYQVMDAYDTREQCVAAMARTTGSPDSSIVYRDKEKRIAHLSFRCLPDTVKP